MRDMAKRDPLAWLPGERFVYADDSLKFTRREWVKIAAGSVLMVIAAAAIMFALSVIQ